MNIYQEKWRKQRNQLAFLALADGSIYRGYSIGANIDQVGEVVFNTGITGYEEIITDPSYAGQIVALTYPEIGNTGINQADRESRGIFINGFVVHNLNTYENWRSEESLENFLIRHQIPAIAGVDTRSLTTKLRTLGTLKGYLCVSGSVTPDEAVKKAQDWIGLDGQDYAMKVSCTNKYRWEDYKIEGDSYWGVADTLPTADLKIIAYDFGIKWNILRNMRLSGMDVTVTPAKTPASEILAMKPDGVFFSNGPADPAAVSYAITHARELIGKIPIMGICLGHQILGLACKAKTFRLKFGHHGCNHPVMELESGEVEITSQNHNFAIDPNTIDSATLEVTHVNLNDHTVEGIQHRSEPMFAVQYHPEGGPGPHDPQYLFNRFRDLIGGKFKF